MEVLKEQQTLSTAELVKLCAVDNVMYEKTFFPKAARQDSAPFHIDLWRHLEDSSIRFLNVLAFRDSAKTTKCRLFTSKRIAYNVSKTILYVGSSEAHASRSIQWLRSRIEARRIDDQTVRKDFFAQVFDLSQGKKWDETQLEVFHGVDSQPIWILGVGITGTNVRGINFDDYRPDLIVLDDILTDENGKSKDQRDTIADLVTSALKNSLAPKSDAPNAKLLMLNTPQDGDDVAARAEKDSEWTTIKYSCWTPETQGLPVDEQISSWPSRWPTEDRRAEKRAAVKANRLSSFVKEKEVRIVTKENAIFLEEWLQYYDNPHEIEGQTVLFIDPTPPPDEKKGKKEINKLDYEVVGAIRRNKNGFYLLDYELIQGSDPDWTCAKFFEMVAKWRPFKAAVEGNAYQKTLKWILEKEMKQRQRWITVETPVSVKNKALRIQTVMHGVLSNKQFFCRPEHTELIEQVTRFPSVEHDDVLDGVAIGVSALTNAYVNLTEAGGQLDNSNIIKIKPRRFCP